MNEKFSVSVVMPSYNHARFIGEAIDSVLSQNYSNLDLLVMDGGSSDGTVEILKSYKDRITFVAERDKGQSDAINKGLARVKGDIVCWLNSDDLFTPTAIHTVVRTFEEYPKAEFVYGKGWNIDETGKIISEAGVLPFNRWRLIHQRNFIQQPSCFFKKSLLTKVGLIDESLHYVMDWDLWIRFSAYQGVFISENLSKNRTYRTNKTESGQLQRWQEIRTMVRRYTQAKWPPVLRLYLLEAIIQMIRARSQYTRVTRPLEKLFFKGIIKEMSGQFADGSIAATFHFSIGNPLGKESLNLIFTPLSKYDHNRLGQEPITIHWQSSNGNKGQILLLENGHSQVFTLPLGLAEMTQGFIHFRGYTSFPGQIIEAREGLPCRRVVGFLDEITIQD